MLVWGQRQTDAWLAIEFGFVLGNPTADGGFAKVQLVTDLGDAVLLLNDCFGDFGFELRRKWRRACGIFDVR